MADRHDITLREAERGGPPDWIDEVKRAVNELFPEAKTSARKMIWAKGEKALAEVSEIKARVMKGLGELEIERQRLVQEREAAIRSDQKDLALAAIAHKEKMYELRTQRLKAVIECAKALKELGVRVNLREVASQLVRALKEDDSGPADQAQLEPPP